MSADLRPQEQPQRAGASRGRSALVAWQYSCGQVSVVDEARQPAGGGLLNRGGALAPACRPLAYVHHVVSIGALRHRDLGDHLDVALEMVDAPLAGLRSKLVREIQPSQWRSTVDPPD